MHFEFCELGTGNGLKFSPASAGKTTNNTGFNTYQMCRV